MPVVRVKVYNTQNNQYRFDQDVNVDKNADIKPLIDYNPSSRYTDKDTREDPFSPANEDKLVQGDITIFESASSSKAG